MPRIFSCPCGQKMRVPSKFFGQKINCPSCRKILHIPQSTPRAVPAEPPKKNRSWGILMAVVVVAGVGLGTAAWAILSQSKKNESGETKVAVVPKPRPKPSTHKKVDPNKDKVIKPPEKDKDKKVEPKPVPPPPKTKEPTSSATAPIEVTRDLNQRRKDLGLQEIAADVDRSKKLEQLARSMIKSESTSAPKGSMMILASPSSAVEQALGAVFYRIPLLDADLSKLAVGHAKLEQKEVTLISPIVIRKQIKKLEPSIYPPADQNDVPIAFPGNEIPDPIPEAKFGSPAGYPITVAFPERMRVRKAKGSLQSEGKDVSVWFSSPESPANPRYPRHQSNTLTIIAKEVLKPGTKYTVEMSAEVDGNDWSRKWSFTTITREAENQGMLEAAMETINRHRKAAGLIPVVLDDALTKAAMNHARYLAIHEDRLTDSKFDMQSEDPKLPGYTKEGAKHARLMHIGQAPFDPVHMMESWVAEFHYRFPILDPAFRRIGFGCARGAAMWIGIVLPDTQQMFRAKEPAIYPAPGQKEIPLTYDSGESPDPIPESKDRNAGFPITVQFPRGKKVTKVRALLTLAKKAVPFWVSTPEKPIEEGFQRNTVCIIAKKPLASKSVYRVTVEARVDDEEWEKTWEFTTVGTGFDENKETNQGVLARLNLYRRQAGLRPVTISKKLSEGCYAHARYLLRNWGHPAVKGLGMHDEKKELPGYTKEGEEAGQASVIATGSPAVDSVDDWMATFYHRMPLLNPDLTEIGFGMIRGGPNGWITILDSKRGARGPGALVFPRDGQKKVPTRLRVDAFIGSYLKQSQIQSAGYPITIVLPTSEDVDRMKVTLKIGAKEIDTWLMKPPVEKGTPTIVSAIPQQHLSANSTCTVKVEALIGTRVLSKEWQFQTR